MLETTHREENRLSQQADGTLSGASLGCRKKSRRLVVRWERSLLEWICTDIHHHDLGGEINLRIASPRSPADCVIQCFGREFVRTLFPK